MTGWAKKRHGWECHQMNNVYSDTCVMSLLSLMTDLSERFSLLWKKSIEMTSQSFELKVVFRVYGRRCFFMYGWASSILSNPTHPGYLGVGAVTVKQRGRGLQTAEAEHTACYPDMRMSGQLHRQRAGERKLPTREWCRCAQGQHDKWGWKAAGGHKSIPPLLSSLLR